MSPIDPFPRSVAIAGAWGYIGRKFLDAALANGLTPYVFDPGPMPAEVDPARIIRVENEAAFHALPADLFHLAVHPEHRQLDLLLARDEPLLILNEKPMALPECPNECRRIVDAVDASRAIVLYDFPELFDPLTADVLGILTGFRDVSITSLVLQRSKDREDPSIARNSKRMVTIQYQESVHCLAYALYLLGTLKGGFAAALEGGVRVAGESDPYEPPNPEAYPYVVDGRCRYRATLGRVAIEGLTDFKRGAPWVKRRLIRGIGDGRPFEIDVSYLEGKKSLRVDGRERPCDPTANSYAHVLSTALRWSRKHDRAQLLSGLFPHPRFTRLTYHLSAALRQSCRDRTELRFASARDLLDWGDGNEMTDDR